MIFYTPLQWVIVLLIFILGVLIGMFLFAGSKWKRRYREELARRETLERENEQLRRDAREMESLRYAAGKAPGTPFDPDDRVKGPL